MPLRHILLPIFCLSASILGAEEGSRWPALPSYIDDVTGARVYKLTDDDFKDDIIYQTHPQWVDGMTYFLFDSNRTEGQRTHALEMATGMIKPVVPHGVGNYALSSHSGWLYGIKARSLGRIYIPDAFEGTGEWQELSAVPDEVAGFSGGMFVGVEDGIVYVGAQYGDEAWGIEAYDTVAKSWKRLFTVDFKVGHVQANPILPGVVMFCQETGGDAEQRTWLYEPGKEPRPAYKETYNEWVTHEAWWGPDTIIFTIWPYDDAHKAQMHGVITCNVQTGEVTELSRYPAWHTQGSPDGRWAMGDDFDRNIWLIDMKTKERTLLTQGHNSEVSKAHPHASFTPDSTGIVFNSNRGDRANIYLVELPHTQP